MKHNPILLLGISFFQSFVFYGPISTLYRESRGIDIGEIFIIEAIFLVTVLVFEIPWGMVADRMGYRNTLLVANVIFFISKLVFLFAGSFFLFSLERVLMAIAISGLSGCDSALAYESLEGRDPQKYFGKYYAAGTLGFVAASVSGSWIAGFSYSLTVLLSAIFYGVAAVLTLFLKEPPRDVKEARNFRDTLRISLEVLKVKRFLIFISLFVGVLGVAGHSLVFLNQLQFQRAGIPVAFFGLLVAGLEMVRLVAARTHILTQRAGEKAVLAGAALAVGIAYLVLSQTASSIVSILSMAVILGALAVIQPLIQDILNRNIAVCRATLLSLSSWVGSVIGIALNPAVGYLSRRSVSAALLALGLLSVLAAGGFLAVLGSRAGQTERQEPA